MTSQTKRIDHHGVPQLTRISDEHPGVGYHILVIDSNSEDLSEISELLKRFRYRVVTVTNSLAALREIWEKKNGEFDLVLADDNPRSIGGLDFVNYVFNVLKLPIAVMTTETNHGGQQRALANYACVCLTKPLTGCQVDYLWQDSLVTKVKMEAPRTLRVKAAKALKGKNIDASTFEALTVDIKTLSINDENSRV